MATRLVVGAELGQHPALDHAHPVGPGRGGQPVGDDDGGAALHQALDGGLHHGLGAGVEAGGRLVEHEHLGVGQGGPGERDQLLLPRRQAAAALADLGVEAVGQAGEALPHPDRLQGGVDLDVRCAPLRHPHVVADRAVEQEALLRDDRDPLAQRVERRGAQVDAPVGHGALGRVVEAGHQLRQGRLPRTGGPDQRQPLPRLDHQVDVAEHLGGVGCVGEPDAGHHDRPPRRQVDGVGCLGDVGLGVEQLVQLLEPGPARLHLVEQLRQLLHRVEQVRQRQHEEGDGADGEGVVDHHPTTDQHHQGRRPGPGHLDHRQVPGLDPHRTHVGPVQAPVAALEAIGLDALPGVGLDDPHPGQPLLEVGQHEADAIPHGQVGGVGVTLELDAGQHHERQRDGDDEQEGRRRHRQQAQGDHDQQHARHELQEAELHQLLESVDVGGHPADDDARLLPVVEGHRQAEQVAEDPGAHVAQEALADAGDEDDLGAVDEEADQRHHDVEHHHPVEGVAVAGLDAVVDARPHEERPGHRGQGVGDDEGEGQVQLPAVGAQAPRRPPEHLARSTPIEAVLLADAGVDDHDGPPTDPTASPSTASPSTASASPSPASDSAIAAAASTSR